MLNHCDMQNDSLLVYFFGHVIVNFVDAYFFFLWTCYSSVEVDGSLADLDGRLESGSKKRYETKPSLLPFYLACLIKLAFCLLVICQI